MRNFILLLLVFGTLACQNSSTPSAEATETDNKVDELKEQVMAAHDRVMPKMSPMGRQQSKLADKAKGSVDSAIYYQAAADLKQAQQKMMDWMRAFEPVEENNWSEEEKLEYLQSEKEKMLAIEEFTNKAMARADSLLGGGS